MNAILNILILVLLGAGMVALYIHQKRSRAILRILHAQQMSHVWSTIALHKTVIDSPRPLPAGNSWALSSDLLVYLVRKILREQPQTMVELGSGLSTVVMGSAMKSVGGQLISVEADPAYLDKTRIMVADAGLDGHVTLIHAPLEAFDAHHVWYSKDKLGHLVSIDLLLVDGPPATTCHFARYPALPFFSTRLNHSAAVILDDAARADEQQVIQRWKNEYPGLKVSSLSLAHAPVMLTFPHGWRSDKTSTQLDRTE